MNTKKTQVLVGSQSVSLGHFSHFTILGSCFVCMENEQKLHCQTKPRLVSSQVIMPHSLSTVQKRRLPRAYGQGSAPHQSPEQKSREQHQRREVSLTLEKQWSFEKVIM